MENLEGKNQVQKHFDTMRRSWPASLPPDVPLVRRAPAAPDLPGWLALRI